MQTLRRERYRSLLRPTCLLGAPLVVLSLAWSLPIQHVGLVFLSDDSYFYLVLARNLAEGAVSSFDGIETTNGYHPLWLLLIAPVFLAGASLETAVRLVITLGIAALAGAAFRLYQSVLWLRRDASAPWLATSATMVLYLLTGINAWFGLESHIAMVAVIALCTEVARDSSAARANPLRVSLFALLCVFARLDSILMVGPILLGFAWRRPRRVAVLAFGPLAVLLGLYLVVSKWAFGHALPISGAIKSSFPHPVWPTLPPTDARWLRIGLDVALCALVATLAIRQVKRPRTGLEGVSLAFLLGACGGLAHLGYELFFHSRTAWALQTWHFACPFAFAITAIAVQTARSTRFVGKWAALGLLLSVPALAFLRLGPARAVDPTMSALYDTALWLRSHPPAEAKVLAATDPGLIAYYSEHRTYALDGLINNDAYQHTLANGELERYLDDRSVAYIVILGRGVAEHRSTHRVRFDSPIYGGGAELELAQAQRIEEASPIRRVGVFQWSGIAPIARR